MRKVLIYMTCMLSALMLAGCGYDTSVGSEKNDRIESEESHADKLKREESLWDETESEESDMADAFVLSNSPLLESVSPQQENMADLLQSTSAGLMVRVTAEELIGSGVIYGMYKEVLVVATAGHLLEKAEGGVWLTFSDGFAVESAEYIVSDSADLAFIKVALREIPEEHLRQYYCVNTDKESFDALKSGDGIIVMGSKSEAAGDAYEGILTEPWIYVEDFAQYMMLAKVEAYPGMSGGGLFDLQGHFLGILCGFDEDGEAAVVPFSILEAAAAELIVITQF